ncbi:MAG: LamG-like jellyroll fold domain-containing protein, partial [Candidatus Riflemargulisbacteria bacterium]
MSTQISELSKGLIFRAPLSEWNPTRDEVSGTLGTATATYPVISRNGGGRREVVYNGTSSYTTLPTIPAFGTGDFTVIIKINPRVIAGYFVIMGVNNNAFMMSIYNSFIYCGTLASDFSTGYTITANVESTLIYSRTGTTGTLKCGTFTSSPLTDTKDYSSNTIMLGTGAGTNFSGSISLVRIFNYALTPTQITNYSKPEYPIEWVDRG